MRNPSELSRGELESIAERIRDILWRDFDAQEFDPDKEWSVETIEWVSGVLEDAGLKPGDSQSSRADTGRLDRPRGDRRYQGPRDTSVATEPGSPAGCVGSRVYHEFATEDEARAFAAGLDYANDSDLAVYSPYSAGGRWWLKTIDSSGDADEGEPRRPDDPFDDNLDRVANGSGAVCAPYGKTRVRRPRAAKTTLWPRRQDHDEDGSGIP
jgi:hypothetical protein